MEHTSPSRYGDWSACNRHLTAGGSLKDMPWGNPYYEYIQQLISAHEEKKKNIVDEGGDDDEIHS